MGKAQSVIDRKKAIDIAAEDLYKCFIERYCHNISPNTVTQGRIKRAARRAALVLFEYSPRNQLQYYFHSKPTPPKDLSTTENNSK